MLSGDCNICINGKMPSYSATCVECGLSRKNYKPLTNADRIRAMKDEELAGYLAPCACPPIWFNEDTGCPVNKEPGESDCLQCWLDYLKQEGE